MNANQSLEKFRTIAFGYEIASSLIRHDGMGRIILDEWMFFVPVCYRPQVAMVVVDVFENYRNTKGTSESINRFVRDLVDAIDRTVSPILPCQEDM